MIFGSTCKESTCFPICVRHKADLSTRPRRGGTSALGQKSGRSYWVAATSALPAKADIDRRQHEVRFSNRPVGVKRFQAIHYCGSQHHSRAPASLRNRHIGRSIMGSEDEVEQSLWRPCRRQVQADLRTHLIHRPARDVIPPLGGARVSSCDPERPLRRHSFSGPSEFSAINPDAMHNHRQPSR
jgi:hypothetical protein